MYVGTGGRHGLEQQQHPSREVTGVVLVESYALAEQTATEGAAEIVLAPWRFALLENLIQVSQRFLHRGPFEIHVRIVDEECPVVVTLIGDLVATPRAEENNRRLVGKSAL